jgi:hypothetical protein
MTTLLGLIMMYAWVHSIVLVFQVMYKRLSTYEKVVVVTGMVAFFLYVLGTYNQ